MHPHDVRVVHLRHLGHACPELGGVHGGDQAGAALLVHGVIQGVRPEEGQARAREVVVHDRVELVALQPAVRVPPDFPDDVGVRVDGLHTAAELLPETVVVDLVGHVQPPAVDAEPDPVLGDLPQELAHGGVVGIEFGQGAVAPPRGVIGRAGVVVGLQRPGVHVKPVLVSAVRPLFQQVVELKEAPAAVVEHAVQHHPDAPAVGLVDQVAQGLVAAQHGVDLVVVVRVVTVVTGGLKHRAEVNGVHAQALKVIEFIGHAPQVTAHVLVEGGGIAPLLQTEAGDAATAGETIRENLVEDGIPHPLGRQRARFGRTVLRHRAAA